MGYELHVTRADDWTASSSAAIRPDEWARAARDAGLRPETAGQGEAEPDWLLGRQGSAELRLWLLEGRVDVAGAHSDDHIEQLLLLAASIDARLVGDDGELYPLPHVAARTMPDIKADAPRAPAELLSACRGRQGEHAQGDMARPIAQRHHRPEGTRRKGPKALARPLAEQGSRAVPIRASRMFW